MYRAWQHKCERGVGGGGVKAWSHAALARPSPRIPRCQSCPRWRYSLHLSYVPRAIGCALGPFAGGVCSKLAPGGRNTFRLPRVRIVESGWTMLKPARCLLGMFLSRTATLQLPPHRFVSSHVPVGRAGWAGTAAVERRLVPDRFVGGVGGWRECVKRFAIGLVPPKMKGAHLSL